LDSRYFKEPGSQFQLAENLDLSSKTCSKNQTLFDVKLYKKKALKNGNRREQETQSKDELYKKKALKNGNRREKETKSKDQRPGRLRRVPKRGAPRR
jgi:hypothetical protein